MQIKPLTYDSITRLIITWQPWKKKSQIRFQFPWQKLQTFWSLWSRNSKKLYNTKQTFKEKKRGRERKEREEKRKSANICLSVLVFTFVTCSHTQHAFLWVKSGPISIVVQLFHCQAFFQFLPLLLPSFPH